MSDPQAREGPTFPATPYEGQDYFLTATQVLETVTYTPGHYVFNDTDGAGAANPWMPFAGATNVPPGTPS